MKAYLKAADGSFYPLAPKVTTIGRDGCDILLQLNVDVREQTSASSTNGIDQQHAIIEYSDQEDCYVLQDLNTLQGTYVNDVRIQNAAVRLAPKDVIRFGFGGTPYELALDSPPPPMTTYLRETTVAYPTVQHRPAWTQPLSLLSDEANYATIQTGQGLPYITTPTMTIPSAHWTPATQQQQMAHPRPPLRSRPLSAGSRRPTYERLQTIGGQMQTSTAAGTIFSPIGRTVQAKIDSPQTTRPWTPNHVPQGGGWINTNGGRSVVTSQILPPGSSPGPGSPSVAEMASLEREQRIHQLSEEVSRLKRFEMEFSQKDQEVQQLRIQLQEMQSQNARPEGLIMGADPELTNRLMHLENEMTAKKAEIAQLKDQLDRLRDQSQLDPENAALIRSQLNDKIKETSNLRNELERIKKDKNITSGLVTQMQRDMSNKDSSISKLTREIEALKKEIRERDSQISTMTSKVNKLKEVPKSTEEVDARERELISLRGKFKTTENKVSEQQSLIDSLREELEKTKVSLFEEKDVQRKMQLSIETAKAESHDCERAERVVRVDLEQVTKKLERFRNRVVQVTFSTPGIKAPDSEISDDQLLETMKKVIDERTELMRKLKDMEGKLKLADHTSKDFQKHLSEFRRSLQSAVEHLKTKGRLTGDIRDQINILTSVSTDDSVSWMKKAAISLLEGELKWEQDIEAALEKCGVNVKLTNEEPSKHISLLFAKWESAIGEKDRLVSQMAEMESKFKADLAAELATVSSNSQSAITDAAEKAQLEVEEKMNRAIDEIRLVETEKRENLIAAERRKIEELEATVEQLRSNLTDKSNDKDMKLEAGQEALQQLEELQNLEITLREEISRLERLRVEEVTQLQTELVEKDQKSSGDVTSYKEQIKQHSVTICAMEERLTKVMKKNKDYQSEIENFKKVIQELKMAKSKEVSKPEPPPKPKVIIQKNNPEMLAMEQLIVVLRKEGAELKKHIQDQDDVILGLRRDLTGASARLSDITGELSEGQKQEVEKYRELTSQREKEVIEARQQLAKLSRIIDKQKEELKALEAELSREKSISVKYKSTMDEKTQTISTLRKTLEDEKQEQSKQLELLDSEGRITSELTAIGAQCRGERHEQVITRQREALSELRSRAKTLEQARPPLPTQDQALQQVIILKKELAEMRANQALSEDKHIQNFTSLDREVGRARGLISETNAEADMERSAHRETMEALDSSENTFLSMLSSVSHSMGLDGIEGNRPIAHIPKDERDRIIRERERASDKMTNQVKAFKERIARKDELLQGYERDLAKLRQAQELADRKAVQVDSLASDVRSRSEESQYLRESLHQARDKLDQEKRLNTAIKQRKTFHLENERMHLAPASHRCKPEDPRAVLKKKNQRDVMKRKNYEIKTLKTELTDKERHLFESQNRLYTLEHSMSPVQGQDLRAVEIED